MLEIYLSTSLLWLFLNSLPLYFLYKSINFTKFSVLMETYESYWKLLNTFLCFFYISLLNKSVFPFTKTMFNVNKLTNFTVILFTWICCPISGATCQNQVGFDKQILSYIYVCFLPWEVSFQLKILPKNIYKIKCREDEIEAIFNSPCLFTSNALIQFR